MNSSPTTFSEVKSISPVLRDGSVESPIAVPTIPAGSPGRYAPTFAMDVPDWTKDEQGVVFYRIVTTVAFDGAEPFHVECFHRYSTLLRFKDNLKALNVHITKFPGKKVFESNSPEFCDKRRTQLSRWLNSSLAWNILDFPLVRTFLKVGTDEQLRAQAFDYSPVQSPAGGPGGSCGVGTSYSLVCESATEESYSDDASPQYPSRRHLNGRKSIDNERLTAERAFFDELDEILRDADDRMIDVSLHGHWYEGQLASEHLDNDTDQREAVLRALASFPVDGRSELVQAAERIAFGA